MNDNLGFDSSILTDYALHSAMFFVNDHLLVDALTDDPMLAFNETLIKLNTTLQAAHCLQAVIILQCQLEDDEQALLNMNLKKIALRPFLVQAQPAMQMLTLKAYHWLNWDKQSRFCGQCGNRLPSQFLSPEKQCVDCKTSLFPRFSPAIMVLIRHQHQLLLARSKHFTPGVYSALAGFIEIGETAEMAAHREVAEETGIKINNLRYFATQTWPFPDSFMIAFTADYVSGELTIDTNELEDARWFEISQLPNLPNTASIARRLIDSVVEQILKFPT